MQKAEQVGQRFSTRPSSKNAEMQRRGKAAVAARYPPGSLIYSRDRRTKYKVQEDGSWKKVGGQEEGEFDGVQAE